MIINGQVKSTVKSTQADTMILFSLLLFILLYPILSLIIIVYCILLTYVINMFRRSKSPNRPCGIALHASDSGLNPNKQVQPLDLPTTLVAADSISKTPRMVPRSEWEENPIRSEQEENGRIKRV